MSTTTKEEIVEAGVIQGRRQSKRARTLPMSENILYQLHTRSKLPFVANTWFLVSNTSLPLSPLFKIPSRFHWEQLLSCTYSYAHAFNEKKSQLIPTHCSCMSATIGPLFGEQLNNEDQYNCKGGEVSIVKSRSWSVFVVYFRVSDPDGKAVMCDATHECPDGYTCFKLPDGQWGCCPLPQVRGHDVTITTEATVCIYSNI